MNIVFQHVMPNPLRSLIHNADSIWGKEFSLLKGQKVLLNATSGKGKSTFSGTLFGIRKDFEGSLLFDEKDIKKISNLD